MVSQIWLNNIATSDIVEVKCEQDSKSGKTRSKRQHCGRQGEGFGPPSRPYRAIHAPRRSAGQRAMQRERERERCNFIKRLPRGPGHTNTHTHTHTHTHTRAQRKVPVIQGSTNLHGVKTHSMRQAPDKIFLKYATE